MGIRAASWRGTSAAGLASALAIGLAASAAEATPQFARRLELSCASCHLLPPLLNENGLAFQASGYQAPPRPAPAPAEAKRWHLLPLAAWITARYEDQAAGASELYLPKVELVSGGRLGESWSYFAEWRLVSLALAADGEVRDRGGRFEDLFFERSFGDGHAVRFGQFRSLNQVDVSLRLGVSEPLLFNPALPTGIHRDARLAGLDRFSPAARSPSLGYSWRSLAGERASDGLFHFVTLPFVGELSIPLSREASSSASFELRGPPKGAYFETFFRRGLSSLGGHVFVADEGSLATAVGAWGVGDLVISGGAGFEDRDGAGSRWRGSAQAEYFFERRGGLRVAPGVRVEDVRNDDRRATYVSYLALAAPSTRYTYLLQLELRSEESGESFVVDLSAIF
ncbi:MAG TPA: hypothetical protein VMV46_16575 [Thermoanaerobaculia bacterium]|nr:hypothetical protein [Thermoanaerobaculia bacterium]